MRIENFCPCPADTDGERVAFLEMDPPKGHIREPPPPHDLDTFLTPEDRFFQTLHMGGVKVDVDKWILVIDGLVERPYALTLDQLRQLPSKTIASFHECYGSPLLPPKKALRRVGNVQWTGVPLSVLLQAAKPKAQAAFVWSEGLDRGSFGGVEADRYQKDLPLEKALRPEVMVVYAMNSEPLAKNRGGPVRLVVPGWFGTNSTKYLCKLTLEDRRAPGPFTTTFYNERHPADDPTCESRPIWKVQPNSMIVSPAPKAQVVGPKVPLQGWAWSHDDVSDVSVSIDEGKSWVRADVDGRTDFSWQRFTVDLNLPPGCHTILSRARSPSGRSQPLGEGRNHVHRVTIDVA